MAIFFEFTIVDVRKIDTKQRSQYVTYETLECCAAATNVYIDILITSNDRLCAILTEYWWGLIYLKWMTIEIVYVYDGFFARISYYNKNQYKWELKIKYFNVFYYKRNATVNNGSRSTVSVLDKV